MEVRLDRAYQASLDRLYRVAITLCHQDIYSQRKMFRFNVFSPVLIMTHLITFSCSPINKLRFEREQFLNSNIGGERRIFRKPRVNWFWAFGHPVKLCGLIKRYHMAGNYFLLFAAIHLILLIHFTLKTLIYTLYCGTSKSRIEYLRSIYYLHMAGATPNPSLFNNMFMAQAFLLLSMRVRAAYRLIKMSLLNSNHYHHLHIGQINLSAMSLFYLTPAQWIHLWRWSIKHEQHVASDSVFRRQHYRFSELTLKRLGRMSQRNLIYYKNSFEFTECYTEAGFAQMPNTISRYEKWHKSGEFPPIGTGTFRLCTGLTLMGTCGIVFWLTAYLLAFSYLELSSGIARELHPSLLEIYSNWRIHLSDPKHLLRSFEWCLWSLVQIPAQYEGATIFTDVMILNSHANKLVNCLREELNFYQKKACHYRGARLNSQVSVSEQREMYRDEQRDQLEFNRHLSKLVRLSKLLHLEFRDVKREHSSLLNILVLGSSFCVSYSISLFANCASTAEFFVLLVITISCITPCISALIFCALTESKFRELYRLMSQLSVNKAKLLDNKTVIKLLRGCKIFEEKDRRSFSVLGLHALGPGSFATFFTYLGTAIAFMHRFNSRWRSS